ncbi:AAA family ATPase [Saccharothrix sp. HUAS TT1]|uniref:phosphatase domain-containing protein n=1 Tax=unclassified Saccharothrix TaxID=2593673 RepID=UPI00345C06D7
MSTLQGSLIVTVGIPGSGKTSYAEDVAAVAEPGEVVLAGRDDIRRMLHRSATYSKATEDQVTEVQRAVVEMGLRRGKLVIVHDMNLRARYRRTWAELAANLGATYNQVDFTDVPLKTCQDRDAGRERPVGRVYVHDMWERYVRPLKGSSASVPSVQAPAVSAQYDPDDELPDAVLVDVDGTVALCEGVRDPYDTSRYHLDKPNTAVVDLVVELFHAGYQIVYCSGRDERYRDVTAEWIRNNVGYLSDELHMRPEGDTRRDDIVKLELFDKNVRDRFNVAFVLDDRNRVVRAWRSIGLTVLQVAEGNF